MKPVKSNRYIEFIDFARGFSILAIVMFHYLMGPTSGWIGKAINLGGAGVHTFIILSGFGLGLSCYGGDFSASRFYKRRFYKILIPYYLLVTLIFTLNHYFPLYPSDGLYAYLGHLFGYKMFDSSIFGSFGYPLWFLSVIIALYLFFPVLIAINAKSGHLRLVIMMTLVSLVYWSAIIGLNVAHIDVYHNFFLKYLWEFSVGFGFATLYMERGYKFWDQKIYSLVIIAILGIGLLGVLAVLWGDTGKVVNDIPAAFGFTAIVALTYKLGGRLSPVLVRSLCYIGTISYELYLVHAVIMAMIIAVFFKNTGAVPYALIPIIFSLAVFVAILYKKIITTIRRSTTRRVEH